MSPFVPTMPSVAKRGLRVVLVDHYDSFTFNLFQQIAKLTGDEPVVVRCDALDLDALRALRPTHVVLSPGPGSPDIPSDFGVSADVVRTLSEEVPTLGVCLGHQGIVHHLGGHVDRAPRIVHGKVSRIRVDPRSTLFRDLPEELEVMRYHSLAGRRATLPSALRETATSLDDDVVMGVEHAQRPLFGVQFHPESIGTPLGDAVLARFLAVERRAARHAPPVRTERFDEARAAEAEAELGALLDAHDDDAPDDDAHDFDVPDVDTRTAAFVAEHVHGEDRPLEPVEVLVGYARALRRRASAVDLGRVIDTCGTGGSGVPKPNISTMAAVVAASLGVRVAKHGNRSARASHDHAGSSDVLEQLGVPLALAPEAQRALVDAHGLAFLHAPAHHPALARFAAARRAVGRRTVFNLLGPLVHPAGASRQLLGTSDPLLAPLLARALAKLGTERALVFGGAVDELAPGTRASFFEVEAGVVVPRTIDLPAARGGDGHEALTTAEQAFAALSESLRTHREGLASPAEAFRATLAGRGPIVEFVALAAGVTAALATDEPLERVLHAHVLEAQRALDEGRALAHFEAFRATASALARAPGAP